MCSKKGPVTGNYQQLCKTNVLYAGSVLLLGLL